MRVQVDDPDDPRIEAYVGLRDHDLRVRREGAGGDLAGTFMAEGDLVVARAHRAGFRPISALVDARRTEPLPLPEGTTVYAAAPAVLERITGMGVHRGALALFARRPLPDATDVLAATRRVVVLEGVVNPTNLGVIVRSAAALGMGGALLDPTCADPLYRRAARVAMGEVYAFPYARLPHLPAGLGVVRDAGFEVVALTPDPAARPIADLHPAPDARLALLLGSEGPGLSAHALGEADHRVRIPMHGAVDSLNVGAAAAIACYEVAGRQP